MKWWSPAAGCRLPPRSVRRVVEAVLRGERRRALISVTFLGRDAMRRLNAAHKGHDRPTDVLAFALADPDGRAVGDVYICPWVAGAKRGRAGSRSGEELIRLVVHGTLHALGREHPEGDAPNRVADVAAAGALRGGARMMAMLQLFIAPLLAALLTLWAAWLALAAESDADLPRALGGAVRPAIGARARCRASCTSRTSRCWCSPARRPAARWRGGPGRRRRASSGSSSPSPWSGSLGRPAPAAPGRGRARAHRAGAARRRGHARAVPPAAPPGRLGRRPRAHARRPRPTTRQAGAAERDMLLGVFSLADTTVAEVMTPRIDIVAVDSSARRATKSSRRSAAPSMPGCWCTTDIPTRSRA